jgi:hypothetical protein
MGIQITKSFNLPGDPFKPPDVASKRDSSYFVLFAQSDEYLCDSPALGRYCDSHGTFGGSKYGSVNVGSYLRGLQLNQNWNCSFFL